MRSSLRVAIAVAAFCIGLAGCGSENDAAPTSSASEVADSPADTIESAAPEMTIAEYIEQNGITQTPVRRGDPGSPKIDLPLPEGWRDVTKRAKEGSYVAMETVADPVNPSTIVVYVTKLTGDVDPAKILEYAPAEVQKLPGYEGPKVGGRTTVGGFDATEIGAFYNKNGVRRTVGLMTAVIPGQDGIYVLELNAFGPAEQNSVREMAAATAIIARETRITP